jgi:hypothetical protein
MEYRSIGVVEYWSNGVLEYRSIGVMEYWAPKAKGRGSIMRCVLHVTLSHLGRSFLTGYIALRLPAF